MCGHGKSNIVLSRYRAYRCTDLHTSLNVLTFLDAGFTLVVSPLVSLMEDQMMALRRLGYPAEMLNASASREDVNRVQNVSHTRLKDSIPLTCFDAGFDLVFTY
jgi:hypothetical protein